MSDDAEPERIVYARSSEDLAREVGSMERTRLQAWCAEPGRNGHDVAVRVIDTRYEDEILDIPCKDILAQEPRGTSSAALESTEEPLGEAQQQLTPFGAGCFAAGTTLALAGSGFCDRHPEVKNCGDKFKWGGFGLATMCFVFF